MQTGGKPLEWKQFVSINISQTDPPTPGLLIMKGPFEMVVLNITIQREMK